MSLNLIGPNNKTVNIDEVAVFSVEVNPPNPRNLCFAPEPCPIIAGTDYLETPGPGDDRNIVLDGEEFITKVQIPNWVAGLPGEQDTFVQVELKGIPIDIERLGTADTIVKRLNTVSGLPTIESLPNDKVPLPSIDDEANEDNLTRLEIVGLSLKSVEPLETDNGPHDMYVGLQSYLRPDDENSISKGTMAIHYSSTDSYMTGKWSSIFGMKVVCVLVPAGSCSQFEPTQNEDGTWNPPLKKPLDPDTGLADPKGLVHRLVKNSVDSGYEQNPESAVNKQSIKALEENVEPVPEGEAIEIEKLFECEDSGFKKDPEAPQIEPDNEGAVAFSFDFQGNSEPAATGNMSVDDEVTSPHDSGCKDGTEDCSDRVTHGVAGQPARVMCEGENCGGGLQSSIALAKQATILPESTVYTKDILIDFNKKGVEYLIVGSAARGKTYKDIDLLYKNTDENINKIIQVLQKHNVVPVDINHTIVLSKDVNLDIFSSVPYQDIVYENFDASNVNVNVLGVDCPTINKDDAKYLLSLDTRRKATAKVLKKQNLKSLSTDNYDYSWELSTDGGENWIRMGQKNSSISVLGKLEKNGNLYRVVVTSSSGETATSNAAILSVVESLDKNCPVGPEDSFHNYEFDLDGCEGLYKLHYDFSPCNSFITPPARVTVSWGDNSITSGFRGDSSFNSSLDDLGFPQVQGGSTKGFLSIYKTTPDVLKISVLIETPFEGSSAKIVLECPDICDEDSDSDSDSDSDISNPRNLCFAPEPCPIIAGTDYLETPGPGDDRNIVLNGEEFITKVQIPNWVAGLPGAENTFTQVTLKGIPIDIERLGTADTIVKRLNTVSGLPTIESLPDNKIPLPSIDDEPNEDNLTRLEIVGLSLKSVEPLETDNGPHDMYVGLQSYLRPDDEASVSKGTMAIHYSSTDSYMKGKWSSIFGMKVVCVLVPAGSCRQFEPTKLEDGTWVAPRIKPLDPNTGLADPKGLVHRLVKNSVDSGYEQNPENAVNKQNINVLEDNAIEVPQGEAIEIEKLFECSDSGFKKDPEAPQIEPDNEGAIAFSFDFQGNSEPAATGNMSVDDEVTSPHDSGCKDGTEDCSDRVTHGVAGQPARVMCEGENCNGTAIDSIVLAKVALLASPVYTKDILIDFNKKGVEYLLVGGAARGKTYKDIDVLYKNTAENVNKIIQVLVERNVVPVDINHTIVLSKDVNLDIFSSVPYQDIVYENFKNTTIVNVLGVDCPAINEDDAKYLLSLDTRKK